MDARDVIMPPETRVTDGALRALQPGEASVSAVVTIGEETARQLRERGIDANAGDQVDLGVVSEPVRVREAG